MFISGQKTEILLANGNVTALGHLVNKTVTGIGYRDGKFVPSRLKIVLAGMHKLYRLVTDSGRTIDLQEHGAALFQGAPDTWLESDDIPHTTRDKNAVMHKVERPVAEIGYLPVFGTQSQGRQWVTAVSRSLFNSERAETIPTYFSHLDQDTLYTLMHQICRRQSNDYLRVIRSPSKNLLLHLMARLGVYADAIYPAGVKRSDVFDIPTHLQAKYLPFEAGTVHEFALSFKTRALEVLSETGNFVEKNFVCRARPLQLN